MYGKLFAQMYEGSLGTEGPWQAIVTFQQLIILADKQGIVDMTPEALSRRTTIPLEIIKIGLAALEQPDLHSRTPDEEGRRITRLSDTREWGWHITNYSKYREIRSAEERKEYHRAYWHKRKTQQNSTPQPEQTKAVSSKHKQEVLNSTSTTLEDRKRVLADQARMLVARHKINP